MCILNGIFVYWVKKIFFGEYTSSFFLLSCFSNVSNVIASRSGDSVVVVALCPSYRNVLRYVQILGGWVRVLDVRYRGYKRRTFFIISAHS